MKELVTRCGDRRAWLRVWYATKPRPHMTGNVKKKAMASALFCTQHNGAGRERQKAPHGSDTITYTTPHDTTRHHPLHSATASPLCQLHAQDAWLMATNTEPNNKVV